jgi:hypothetical protein
MRAAALLLAALFLAASARAGDGERVFDVRSLRDASPERRAPRLGLSLGGSLLGSWDLEETEEAAGLAIEEVLGRLGAGDAALLGDGFVVARGEEVAAALGSLGADARRRVRIRVEATGRDGATVGGELLALPGRWATIERTRRRSLLLDSDIELACDNSGGLHPSTIADPIMTGVFDGFAVDARPFFVRDGAGVAFEALVQAGGIEEPVERFRLGALRHGDLDLPRYRGVLLLCSGSGTEEVRVALRGEELAVRLDPEVEGGAGEGPARFLDAGLVLLPAGGLPAMDPEGDEESWADWTRLAAVPQRRPPLAGPLPADLLAPGLVAGPAVAVAGTREEVAAAGRALDALAAPAARAVTVGLVLRAGGEVLATAEFPVLDGREGVLRAGRERMVLADSDVEVGCFTQVPDPNTVPIFEGLLVQARPRVSPSGGAVLLDVALRFAVLDGEPVVRPSLDPINGATHTVRVVERETEADLFLGSGASTRLALGRLPDGRPLSAEVSARVSH